MFLFTFKTNLLLLCLLFNIPQHWKTNKERKLIGLVVYFLEKLCNYNSSSVNMHCNCSCNCSICSKQTAFNENKWEQLIWTRQCCEHFTWYCSESCSVTTFTVFSFLWWNVRDVVWLYIINYPCYELSRAWFLNKWVTSNILISCNRCTKYENTLTSLHYSRF